VVYGGTGKAARNWECFHAIVRSLKALEAMRRCWCNRKAVGFSGRMSMRRGFCLQFESGGHWNNWDRFHELDAQD